MKTVSKLSLLAISIALVGCNEKVSPELQQGNATTPTTTVVTTPDEYSFKLNVPTGNRILNFKLHKTGAGNVDTACEIKNTTGLTNDNYRASPAANDISCYLDAEELDLYHAGFSIEAVASKNTCDYIAYTPFGFFENIPGDSSATYTKVSCSGSPTDPEIATEASLKGVNLAHSGGASITCNEYLISTGFIPQGTRQRFQVSSEEELCAFNYTAEGGDNCDIGVITINEFVVTKSTDGVTTTVVGQNNPRTIRCGGSVAACVRGPVKDMDPGSVSKTEITATTANAVSTVSYSYGALIGTHATNKKYVNFRRDLASKNMNFVDSAGLPAPYKSLWSDPTYGKTFDPQVLDFYSKNRMLDGITPIVTSAAMNTFARRDNRTQALPLAAEPFMGLNGYRVNPFYTFYCLDSAMDIKARIRMMVREWDRIYPTSTSDLEYLSDIFRGATARQDLPVLPEIPDDADIFIPFNDLADWDDDVPMQRTPGIFGPASTVWAPSPTGPYPDGFFNPNYFPYGGL